MTFLPFGFQEKDLQVRVPGIELKNPSSPENTKKIQKGHEISHPESGPENMKKNTEKIRKRSFSGHFRTFSVIFSYFGG